MLCRKLGRGRRKEGREREGKELERVGVRSHFGAPATTSTAWLQAGGRQAACKRAQANSPADLLALPQRIAAAHVGHAISVSYRGSQQQQQFPFRQERSDPLSPSFPPRLAVELVLFLIVPDFEPDCCSCLLPAPTELLLLQPGREVPASHRQSNFRLISGWYRPIRAGMRSAVPSDVVLPIGPATYPAGRAPSTGGVLYSVHSTP